MEEDGMEESSDGSAFPLAPAGWGQDTHYTSTNAGAAAETGPDEHFVSCRVFEKTESARREPIVLFDLQLDSVFVEEDRKQDVGIAIMHTLNKIDPTFLPKNHVVSLEKPVGDGTVVPSHMGYMRQDPRGGNLLHLHSNGPEPLMCTDPSCPLTRKTRAELRLWLGRDDL